jgi:hypothetical protein
MMHLDHTRAGLFGEEEINVIVIKNKRAERTLIDWTGMHARESTGFKVEKKKGRRSIKGRAYVISSVFEKETRERGREFNLLAPIDLFVLPACRRAREIKASGARTDDVVASSLTFFLRIELWY